MKEHVQADRICDQLEAEYAASVTTLRNALRDFLAGGAPPDPALRASGAFAYPSLRLEWPPGRDYPRLARAYARLGAPGAYETTVTRPSHFRDFLVEQLSLLMADFDVTVSVGRSTQEIPFAYVLDASVDLAHLSDAPWVFMLLVPLLLGVVVSELADGGMDSRSVALLGVLAACASALRLAGAGVTGFEAVFFLLIPAGRVLGLDSEPALRSPNCAAKSRRPAARSGPGPRSRPGG